MTEPSQEAWALAHRVDKPVYMLAHDLTWLAVALQTLIDERDEARRVARALACKRDNVTEASQAALAYPKVPHD